MDNFIDMTLGINSSIKKKDGFTGERVCILPVNIRSAVQKNVLCKNLYLTDIGYYPKAMYHDRERVSGCKQYILIYCLHGEGWFSVYEKTHHVRANQFFILPKDITHKYGADTNNPWTIYWVHFTGEIANDYSLYLTGKRSSGPMIVFPSAERNLLFDEIIHYASMINNPDAVIYANNCLYNYLASFKNSIFSESESDQKRTGVIDACIELMKNNLGENLSLPEMATMMGISVSYLSALFKERVHESPYTYYIFLKVQRACYLLWNSSMNIKTIAEELGYDDPYHFSRVFKKTMGVSPKIFRNGRNEGLN